MSTVPLGSLTSTPYFLTHFNTCLAQSSLKRLPAPVSHEIFFRWLDIRSLGTFHYVCKSHHAWLNCREHMFEAAACGYESIVKLHIKHDPTGMHVIKKMMVEYPDGQYSHVMLTLLGCAVANGNVRVVRTLLQRGADPHFQTGSLDASNTPPLPLVCAMHLQDQQKCIAILRLLFHWEKIDETMHRAVLDYAQSIEHMKVIRLLTTYNHAIRAFSTSKATFLTTTPLALINKIFVHLDISSLCVVAGLSRSHHTWFNASSHMFTAAKNGWNKLVKLLVMNNPRLLRAKDEEGNAVLGYAIKKGCATVVRTLLKVGADAKHPMVSWHSGDRKVRPTLMCAAHINKLDDRIKVMQDLLHWGANINAVAEHHVTTLMDMVYIVKQCPDPEKAKGLFTIRFLLKNKVNIRVTTDLGDTPLGVAIKFGSIELVNLFLQADRHALNLPCDVVGEKPLMYAVIAGRIDIVKALFAHQPDIEASDDFGNTALMHAALLQADNARKKEVISLLLAHKADMKTCNNFGNSVICNYVFAHRHDVFSLESEDFIRFLIQQGAEINPPNLAQEDVIWFLSLVPRFLEWGADPNACDIHRCTLLMHAIEKQQVELIANLLAHPKINLQVCDRKGKTALDYANRCEGPHRQMIIDMLASKS